MSKIGSRRRRSGSNAVTIDLILYLVAIISEFRFLH